MDIRFATKDEEKQYRLAERRLAFERRGDLLVQWCSITARISDGIQPPVL
jgi:hypothetical protein